MKIIAFYLPQFHRIPENDAWWGKNYTEWTCLRNAKPLFREHKQPRIPLYENYYDLLEPKVQVWQANLAEQYGIYGFCIYHYWFEGHMLLEKPLENFSQNSDIKLPFCICWANEDWTNGWVSNQPRILLKQTYGGREMWKRHFLYLLPFFQNERYIRIDGSPLFLIYHPETIPCLREMITYWQDLAAYYHLKKIVFASQHPDSLTASQEVKNLMDYQIEYQPDLATKTLLRHDFRMEWPIDRILDQLLHTDYFTKTKFMRPLLKKDYDQVWRTILETKPDSPKCIPGAFVDWDNTPRKGRRGSLFLHVTPEKFQRYLSFQIQNAVENYHKDMVFLFAWNEWSEGGYLEPDETRGFQFLEAIKGALGEENG